MRTQTYVTLLELSRMFGWTKTRTFRWAMREKVIVMVAGRWVTTRERILSSFPDLVMNRMEH